MTWLIIIIIIVGVIILIINKDYNSSANSIVTQYGGMLKKYDELIPFLESSGTPIKKVTKDTVILRSQTAEWWVDCVGDKVEIRYKGFFPVLGKIYNQWAFPHNYPQQLMINEITRYCDQVVERLRQVL